MIKKITREDLIKINDFLYEIPTSFRPDMRVPARLYTSEQMLADILQDTSLEQLVNVATLPGIQQYAYAMPDVHQGYGFPIGGVAAMAIDQGGVISPGGIGYDINCGVRLLAVSMTAKELQPYLEDLATALYEAVPSGVGQGGHLKLTHQEMNKVLEGGAQYMLECGYGVPEDTLLCEENGRMAGARADAISTRAKERASDQLGTLGSGNHFLELQRIDQIYDEQAANALGLSKDCVTIMIHCGSRGLGHQTCTDHVRIMMQHAKGWGLELPDRELICAPFLSPQGQDYFAAMTAASNFGWANRHLIAHWVRKTFKRVVGNQAHVAPVYDISHNIGKIEQHMINGQSMNMIMHRKGATRAFGPGRPEIPVQYGAIGQPVLIPGTMGTASYVMVGTHEGMAHSFGSSCHGAGRKMSRAQAKKNVHGKSLRHSLEHRGIVVRCDSDAGLSEEAPAAYKDVDDVVAVVQGAGIARKVARAVPIAVIKGG